ncbi:MAG: CpsD/CapB family tyrosine-protein kinase [Lachnospiraceae bacterium]|nr:CpsD/CapB family tyrosine-protein kinase [Lachnospiraceae bacterium]
MRKINVEFKDMPYAVEEAMNRLRINIKFCGKNTRKILITSSVPNEGKSSVSINLWKMMAEAGFPAVFVDVDLRKSVIKDRHQINSEDEIQDLGYYLSGLAEYEDVVCETNVKNGYIVPCCNLLENPSALLEDARFKELLDRLAQDYRYVIIDSPPLASVADGAIVASVCDGAVLVVRSGMTSRGLIRQSFQQLEQVNCKLLGVILNRVESTGRAYKKYYGKYGNSYEYGYGYGKKKDSDKEEKK